MSATVAGSIESISIRGRLLPVAADAEVNRDLGGFTNELQPNGDGSARIVKTRKSWKLEGVQVECNEDRGDQQFLQEIADGLDYETITITYASGATYQGRGTIVEDVQFSNQNSTATVTLSGPGELTKQ